MPKVREELKTLLLQVREDEITRREEFSEFVRYSGLREDQIDSLDAIKNPHFSPDVAKSYDAVFVGGSSDASVLQPTLYPFNLASKALMRYCFNANIAVFASCYGFQLAVEEFGGEIQLDTDRMEMGTYNIFLTDEASSDPLLHDFPYQFNAISGHKERAATLPDGAILLAYSELCPYHIFKFADKPFYAFQFHPEVDRNDLVSRITRYQTRYFEDDMRLHQIIQHAKHDTKIANSILQHFVDRIVLG